MVLVEAGVGLAVTVGASVEVSSTADEVRFLPSYLKLDMLNALLQELTLHRLSSRCRFSIFIIAFKVLLIQS